MQDAFGPSIRDLWNLLARNTLCKLGMHSKPTGVGLDACMRGCGFVRHPDAVRPYVVKLKDGTVRHVRAVNPYHAESLVVYGDGPLRMTPGGRPCGEMKIHRANIASVASSTESAE